MRKRVLVLGAAVMFLLAPVVSYAGTVTLALGFEFSGGATPSGFPTVTLDDHNSTGVITMTISSFPLSGGEFIDDIFFNMNPALISLLSFTNIGGTAPAPNGFGVGSNGFKADGDGYFDVVVDYPPPPGGSPNVFGDNKISSFDILAPGLKISDFASKSDCGAGCGNGGWFLAAHIQGITDTGNGTSGWVGPNIPVFPTPFDIEPSPVPEPASLFLLGTGLAGVAARMRRKRMKAALQA